ncbi:MAG TPA: cytochrome c [Steroidobacteraceae bacterium]|nr:cytochrome c [Steroidobacteraceae bacterium]
MIPGRFVRGLALAFASAGVLASTHEVRPGATSATRGAAVFSKYCALCHGGGGAGDGRAASMQKVPPADLTVSSRSRSYKLHIVRDGGAQLGRSSSMPAWRDVLSDAEIADVVEYVETLNPRGSK